MYDYKQLTQDDLKIMRQVNQLFSDVFEEPENYSDKPPPDEYLRKWLSALPHIVLVATHEDKVVGALVAFETYKFEQMRSEIYIYDLAVHPDHREKGIATRLIKETKAIAKDRGAYEVSIESEHGDDVPTNLYRELADNEILSHYFEMNID